MQKPTECYRKPSEIKPWVKAGLFLWYKRFKGGRTSVDDDECSGRSSTSTTPEIIAKVRETILADRRQTIHDVCEIVGLPYGTVQRILVDNLYMRRISARFVPKLLSDDHTAHRVSECRELKQARDNPNFIYHITPVNETWVYGYDPDTKQHTSQWKSPISPRPKKSASISQKCWSFFDIQGTVHKGFVPPGQTVNGKFYCGVFKRRREGIRLKRPDKWKNNN